MDKEYKSKECCRCYYYNIYYTKGDLKFNKAKHGLCEKKRKVVQQHDTCDNWTLKIYSRKSFFKKSALKKLYELLFQLSEIRQILQEDKENEV